MGKKKKGSGAKSGKKKKGGGKKKKSTEPEMSWTEALLAYKINLKEKAMEDLKYELRGLEELNDSHKQRNERLVMEQKVHMQNLIKQAKEFEHQLSQESDVDKHAVMAVMRENWECERDQEKEVQDLKEQLARKETDIIKEQTEKTYWTDYAKKGRYEHEKQIKLLHDELEDMENRNSEIINHFQNALVTAKTKIKSHTDETLDKQKYIATEKAMAKLDKYSRQEVLDNDWLQREVNIHQEEVDELAADVDSLEQTNLTIMSELFDCTVDDLRISKGLYLKQFMEDDNLDESDILQIDLGKLSINQKDDEPGNKVVRPKSSMQRYIEEKVFALPSSETQSSAYDSGDDCGDSDKDDPFDNYYQFDDEDFEDYLKLGPLELKLLNVTGTKMSVYKSRTPTDEEREVFDCNPDEWPVTKPMMDTALIKSERP